MSGYNAVANLIGMYAELIDRGDFAGVGGLLAHAVVTTEGGDTEIRGADAIQSMYEAWTRRYEDNGTPHTKQLHIIERYHLIEDGKVLEVNVHVEDPGAFTMPWDAIQRYRQYEAAVRKVPIERLTQYQSMADFGTCAVHWPLLDAWEADVCAGRMPDFSRSKGRGGAGGLFAWPDRSDRRNHQDRDRGTRDPAETIGIGSSGGGRCGSGRSDPSAGSGDVTSIAKAIGCAA